MPLPSFSWASGAEVWNCMLEKDSSYSKLRTEKMLDRHPSLVNSYRTILLDWLSEVSHECKFHRETYHLALDFIDRYLTAQSNVGKLQLQLIGTTCLFLAAKFEEIRPPTVNEFAELTDGACKPEDIIENEIKVLSAIDWEITPMTPNNWLNTYMQILLNLDKQEDETTTTTTTTTTTSTINKTVHEEQNNNIAHHQSLPQTNDENSLTSQDSFTSATTAAYGTTKDDSFILPANNGIFRSNHKRIASVIDLALLHIESLRFTNSVLTASALYHFTDELTVRQCTGYTYEDLAICVSWLRPFVETIREIREPVFIACCKGEANSTQMHTHIATAKLLDKVLAKMEANQSLKRKACTLLEDDNTVITDSECDSVTLSPSRPTTLLTPPRSSRKSRRVH